MRIPTPRPLWRTLAVTAAALAWAAPALAQITFYENDDFGGRSFTAQSSVNSLQRSGFNNQASSAVVRSNRWEICDGPGFQGRCAVLRPGQYASLAAMGMNDRVTSVRAVGRNARFEDERYAPQPVVAYDYRRRYQERLFEAPVSSVRAVVGTPEQRCWIEREQVSSDRGDARVPGAVFGAVIGGIIGHQVGSGRSRDAATVGGAVVGGVLGANVGRGRDGAPTVTQDVQRCRDVPGSAQPTYWDVTYDFRGQQYRVQLTAAPGPTVTVNRNGEPRG